jgi:ribosome-binding ATPase YchF (GTP1/OBG family)
VRCFEDDNIIHVDGSVDPVRDMDVINLELIFADIAQAEKRMERLVKDVKNKKDGAQLEYDALQKV